MIDLDSFVGASCRFKWREVLWLPRWEICAFPDSVVVGNLIQVIEALDQVSLLIGRDVEIISGYRPRIYNDLIGGSKRSAHIEGKAIDFIPRNLHKGACAIIKAMLKPRLNELKIRMEDVDQEKVHIDCRQPGPGGRFFKP